MSAKNDIIHNDFLSGEEADSNPSDTNLAYNLISCCKNPEFRRTYSKF